MTAVLYAETTTQFLARMILATREQHQISSVDARRLGELAQFGPGGPPTTMPEARLKADRPLAPSAARDLVTG
jgi:hypothetical protein